MSVRTAIICLLRSALLGAHGGGLDSQGGHHDRKNGGYHFHRGPLKGRSFSSKTEAARALRGAGTAEDTRKESAAKSPKSTSENFECGSKRTCGQMSSCAEARFYLNECGLSRLDGDKDGIPCESLCR